MSTLRERIEGLIASWLATSKLECLSEYESGASYQAGVCSDELAAALAAEGQGDGAPAEDSMEEVYGHFGAAVDAPQMANLIALLKHTIGSCVDNEPHDKIRAELWKAVKMAYKIMGVPAAAPSLHKEGLPPSEELRRLIVKAKRIWEEFYSYLPDGEYNGLGEMRMVMDEIGAELLVPAALHKEGAGGEPLNEIDLVRAVLCAHQTAYAKAHNGEGRDVIESDNIAIGYASVELAKLLAQRTLPDEQFKGAVVEPIEQAVDNEISITIRGQEQVAIVMEALHKAGFVVGQAASPAGRAEPPQTCSNCGGKTWFTANGLCERCSPDVSAAKSATPSKS